MIERTLAIVKPDAVADGFIGKILTRAESLGRIVDLWMVTLSREEAEWFYAEHKGKSFFDDLIAFTSSGPLVVVVLEGEDVIAKWRATMGPADANKATMDTLRGLYGNRLIMYRNAVHGSDSWQSAVRELELVLGTRARGFFESAARPPSPAYAVVNGQPDPATCPVCGSPAEVSGGEWYCSERSGPCSLG